MDPEMMRTLAGEPRKDGKIVLSGGPCCGIIPRLPASSYAAIFRDALNPKTPGAKDA